ncbi:MAG: extracellular solute-binding protein [Clostridia bacterium]|nr:extracellular solute-binding protein [Clostridia bacterium]
MKKMKKIVPLALCGSMLLGTLSACGGTSSSDVQFWVYGSEQEIATYTEMTEYFNQTYGKEKGIKVVISSKPPSAYNTAVKAAASTKSGPDIFLEIEDNFKRDVNANLIADITAELNAVTDIDVSDIYPTIVERLRYDKETNTSNEDDPLYGLPVDTKPTGLYYNATLFDMAGVNVISVDEADLAKWNNNEIADKNGKKISDFPELWKNNKAVVSVPAKGYYRSENPYVGRGQWRLPAEEEILVFNNRIAMNWDEVEDLARLFVPSYNAEAVNFKTEKSVGVKYGYFTEWWFNYGWSVGGDCLEDLTGNGDWNFSLLDPNPNFIVAEGKEYTGDYTGKKYKAGETVEFTDKLEVPKGQTLVPNDEGGYTYNGTEVSTRQTVLAAAENGTLIELPSTREAFTRYLKLGAKREANIDDEGGLDVSPNPNIFNNRTRVNYFFSGELAMLVDYSIYMAEISEYMDYNGFEWDVAPLVIYKEYQTPNDPDDATVKVMGKPAGQSNSTAMVVRRMSEKKDKAATFIKWMASKQGQSVRTKDGFFPNQESLIGDVKFDVKNAPNNVYAFCEALEFQGAGDWWYMADYEWINVWAVPLNTYVRNGQREYREWYKDVISKTNVKLKEY